MCSCCNSRGHPSLLPLQTALFTHPHNNNNNNTHTHVLVHVFSVHRGVHSCSRQLRSIKPYTCCLSPSQEKVCTPGLMVTASAAAAHLVLWSLRSGGFQPGADGARLGVTVSCGAGGKGLPLREAAALLHATHQAWPISSTWPQKPQSSASSLS